MGKKKKRYMIRSIIAVVLTALSLGCLFWPSIINLSEMAREEYLGKALDQIENRYGSEEEFFEAFKKEAVEELKDAGYSTSKAKSLTSATIEMEKIALTGKFSFFGIKTVFSYYDRISDELSKDSPLSDLVKNTDGLNSLRNLADEGGEALKIISIVLNVLFWCMIGFGALAILMYLLGQNRVFGILYTILAFLVALVFIGIVVLANIGAAKDSNIEGDILTVGISSIAMPLLALAACIVYKRDKKGAASVEAPVETVTPAAPQPPVNPQWNAQPAAPQPPRQAAWNDASGWGQRQSAPQPPQGNPWAAPQQPKAPRQPQNTWASAPQQPTAEAAVWTCPVCGTKNPTSTAFCPNCGTKQE